MFKADTVREHVTQNAVSTAQPVTFTDLIALCERQALNDDPAAKAAAEAAAKAARDAEVAALQARLAELTAA